jgi:hypothetical protein
VHQLQAACKQAGAAMLQRTIVVALQCKNVKNNLSIHPVNSNFGLCAGTCPLPSRQIAGRRIASVIFL